VDQGIGIHGLGQMDLKSARKDTILIFVSSEGREGDRRKPVGVVTQSSDLPDQFKTVIARHTNVGDNNSGNKALQQRNGCGDR